MSRKRSRSEIMKDAWARRRATAHQVTSKQHEAERTVERSPLEIAQAAVVQIQAVVDELSPALRTLVVAHLIQKWRAADD